MEFFDKIFSNIGLFFETVGLLTGIPLTLTAIVCFLLISERSLFFILLNTSGVDGIRPPSRMKSSHYHKFGTSISVEKKQEEEELLHVSEKKLADIYDKLQNNLGAIKFISGISPTLGLFGTVIGIMDVFDSIAHTHSAVSPAMISAGLRKAMFTTAFGLAISIPALIACSVFSSIISKKMKQYADILLD